GPGAEARTMGLSAQAIADVVTTALREDVGTGDLTTGLLVPRDNRCRAELLLEEPGISCGIDIAAAVFTALDPAVLVTPLCADGTRIENTPAVLAQVTGPTAAILTGERTALNLVARLCGIATLTRRYVDQVAGTGVTILDTR